MNLKAMRAAALKAAQTIVAKATAESRDLTPDEIKEVEAKTAEIKSLDEQIEQSEKSAALIKSIGGVRSDQETPDTDQTRAKSIGEHFVKHAGQRLTQIKGQRGAVASAPEYKAATDTVVTGGATGALGPALTDVDRTLVAAFRRPLVTDLFGSGTINGSAITYFVEGALEGAFAAVAEAGKKPQLSIGAPTRVMESLSKIAGWIKVTDEMVEDADFLMSEINARLLYELALAEESQLINGNGTAPNLRGLLQRAGIQTEVSAAADDNADALYRAIAKVQTATGLAADGLVINPQDYQALRLSKDANGQYFGGGFFTGQYGNGGLDWQPPVWGLRTVVSSAVAAGTPVVGAFEAAATVYRKGGVRVESTNSNQDDFIHDLVTIRAEERVALAVRKPAAFVKVTLSDDPVGG